MKYMVEKVTWTLLVREADQVGRNGLSYAGSRGPPTLGYNLRLRFEAALPEGNWYSLGVVAWVPQAWLSKDEFTPAANRSFEFWSGKLGASPSAPSMEAGSPELYDERADEAVQREEALALQKEDPEPIRQIQRAILEGLRRGKSFRTAHHEGGSNTFFDGKNFVRETYGEEESRRIFSTDDELLGFIREFYDWESRRETFPHRPPELEVWRFIQNQLLD